MIKQLIKQLLCNHEFINTNENWTLFSTEHTTQICVKCGKTRL